MSRAGVFVRWDAIDMAGSVQNALVLAQVLWLVQPSDYGKDRCRIVHTSDGPWIALSLEGEKEWPRWLPGLGRDQIKRALHALEARELIETRAAKVEGVKRLLVRALHEQLPDDTEDGEPGIPPELDRAESPHGYRAESPQSHRAESPDVSSIEGDALKRLETPPLPPTGGSACNELALDLIAENPADHRNAKRETRNADLARFQEFYDAYPLHVGRGDAERAWRKAIDSAPADVIIAAARRYATATAGTARQYVKQPSGWLNAKRWLDEELPAPSSGPVGGGLSTAAAFDQIADRLEAAEASFAGWRPDGPPPVDDDGMPADADAEYVP